MPKLILDASQVICWSEELRDTIVFDKLRESGFELIIPDKVAGEVQSDNEVADYILSNSEIRKCPDRLFEKVSNRHFRLGAGETAVITLGERHEQRNDDYICVVDDGLARDTCEKIGLEFTGTIGLMGILVDQDLLDFDEADGLIEKMKKEGTHLPDNHSELLRHFVSNK